jgi:anti-sigma-K factor RskA
MSELHLLTGAYAMNALDDVERAGFERHLRSCGSCAAEVIEFQEVTGRLAGRVAMDPPPHLRSKVLAEVTRTRQLSPTGRLPMRRLSLRRMLATACAAAVIAGSAGLGGVAWQGHRAAQEATEAADRVARRSAQLAAVMTDPHRIEVDQPSTAGGTATIMAAGGQAVLVAHRLTAPPNGKTYQVWLFDSKGVHSVELLKLRDGSGQTLVPGVAVGSSIAVTVEPAGGSSRPTTEPVLNLLVA